jgi:hypothetical protein
LTARVISLDREVKKVDNAVGKLQDILAAFVQSNILFVASPQPGMAVPIGAFLDGDIQRGGPHTGQEHKAVREVDCE